MTQRWKVAGAASVGVVVVAFSVAVQLPVLSPFFKTVSETQKKPYVQECYACQQTEQITERQILLLQKVILQEDEGHPEETTALKDREDNLFQIAKSYNDETNKVRRYELGTALISEIEVYCDELSTYILDKNPKNISDEQNLELLYQLRGSIHDWALHSSAVASELALN